MASTTTTDGGLPASGQISACHAQGLVSRLSQDACTDLVASAIAEAPGRPGALRPDKTVVAEVRKRTLTTVADAPVP